MWNERILNYRRNNYWNRKLCNAYYEIMERFEVIRNTIGSSSWRSRIYQMRNTINGLVDKTKDQIGWANQNEIIIISRRYTRVTDCRQS